MSKSKLEAGDVMVSFDVVSLYTNVPIDETIELIKKEFFTLKPGADPNKINLNCNDKKLSKYHGEIDGMHWELFEHLLRRCLQESVFVFNNKLYKQIDGISMGLQLGPSMANIFMHYFENKHMEHLKKLGLKEWGRYVDDTATIINNVKNAEQILKYLNEQHETIKFTMEIEENGELNFLDVKIKRKGNSFVTSTYHKPTFTGVMLNWNSLTSVKYKKGLIHCMLDRSNKICSSEIQKEIEKTHLRSLFLSNNYPNQIIDKEFEKFEKYKTAKTFEPNSEKTIDPELKIKYLSLPYLNDKSEIIARKIQNLVKENFNKINLRIAFKAPATLADHFPFKDKVTDPKQQSNVIYHIKCNDCNADYIGKSIRICNIRMKEHDNEKSKSNAKDHEIESGHKMDYDDIKILDRASNDLKLSLKEMLYIRKLKPSLNKQLESELFTLIIRNTRQENSITRDIQKYLKPKNNNKSKN